MCILFFGSDKGQSFPANLASAQPIANLIRQIGMMEQKSIIWTIPRIVIISNVTHTTTHSVYSVVELGVQFIHCDDNSDWPATLVSGKQGVECVDILRQEVCQFELALCKQYNLPTTEKITSNKSFYYNICYSLSI